MKRLLVALWLCGIAASPAAADYQAGVDAYHRGDFLRALDEWRPLAEAGNAVAQNSIGALYDHGLGVTENNPEAARWYLSAAELGLPLAMRNLAALYAAGDGLPQDLALARTWYERAAALGDAPSAAWLQKMHAMIPAADSGSAGQDVKQTDKATVTEPAPAGFIAPPAPAPVAAPAPQPVPTVMTPAPPPSPPPSSEENWLLGAWQGPSLGCPPGGGVEFAPDRSRSWYNGSVSAEFPTAYAIAGDEVTVTTSSIDGGQHAIVYKRDTADSMKILSIPRDMPQFLIGVSYRRCAG